MILSRSHACHYIQLSNYQTPLKLANSEITLSTAGRMSEMRGGGFHVLLYGALAAATVMALASAIAVTWVFAKALASAVTCLYNRMQFTHTLQLVRLLSVVQAVIACGFTMFGQFGYEPFNWNS